MLIGPPPISWPAPAHWTHRWTVSRHNPLAPEPNDIRRTWLADTPHTLHFWSRRNAQDQLLQDWALRQRARGVSDKTITDRLTFIPT